MSIPYYFLRPVGNAVVPLYDGHTLWKHYATIGRPYNNHREICQILSLAGGIGETGETQLVSLDYLVCLVELNQPVPSLLRFTFHDSRSVPLTMTYRLC